MVAHVPLQDEPSSVRAYATGARFRQRNALDLRLWHAASAALDERWAANRQLLDERLATYRSMLQRARGVCTPLIHRAASERLGGEEISKCYWRDNGCGYPCFDRLFKRT